MTATPMPLLLLILCFLPIPLLHAAEAEIPEQAQAAVQKQVLDALKPDTNPARMYSRMRLTPPSVQWRESISPGIQSFVVTHGANQKLLGLYDRSNDQVWLLNVSTRTYVEPSKHPVVTPPRT